MSKLSVNLEQVDFYSSTSQYIYKVSGTPEAIAKFQEINGNYCREDRGYLTYGTKWPYLCLTLTLNPTTNKWFEDSSAVDEKLGLINAFSKRMPDANPAIILALVNEQLASRRSKPEPKPETEANPENLAGF